jgi:putative flippase GtrA
VFTVLLKLLHVHHLASLAAAWLVGVVFSYVLNHSWVFRPEEKLRFRASFGRFVLASLVSVGLNMVALDVLVRQTGQDPFWIQMGLIPLVVLFNFWTAKFWSLRRKQQT